MILKTLALAFLPALLAAAPPDLAAAQSYPTRPVTIVVPFPAGGSLDLVGRALGDKLGRAWGQTFIIENQTGASGAIGAARVAKSDPDGTTLLIVSTTFTINAAVLPKTNFDPVASFMAVALVGRSPMVVATANGLGFKTAADLVAYARAHPGKLNFGSSGHASINHIGAEMLRMATGVQINHVPYRGAALALNDLVGGHVDLLVGSLPAMLEQVRAGNVTALAVSSLARVAVLPDVPTLNETVAPGAELYQWWGVLAPAGTAAQIVAALNSEINKALASPEIIEILAREGAEATPGKPEILGTRIGEEIERWRTLAKQANIRLE